MLVPVTAVFARPEGPVVFRKTTTGWQKVPVQVGPRSRTQVVDREGGCSRATGCWRAIPSRWVREAAAADGADHRGRR